MTINFNCPECGKKYSTEDKNIGFKFVCKQCKTKIQVPDDFIQENLNDIEKLLDEKKYDDVWKKIKPYLNPKNPHKEIGIIYSILATKGGRNCVRIEETPTWEDIAKIIDKTIIKDPTNSDLFYYRGVVSNGFEPPEKAYKYFLKSYKLRERADAAEMLALFSFNDFDNITATKKWFERAADLGSKSSTVYNFLLVIYPEFGEHMPQQYLDQAEIAGSSRYSLSNEAFQKIIDLVEEEKKRLEDLI